MSYTPMNTIRYYVIALVLAVLCSLPIAVGAQDTNLTGSWMGTLTVGGGAKLRVVFNIRHDENGSMSSTLDSPDQGATGFPTGQTLLTGSTLEITIPAIAGNLVGTIESDGGIEGTWAQGGVSLPLRLVRTEVVTGPSRPQTPMAPFPYRTEDVTVGGGSEGVTLGGTLTIPVVGGPFPAVVLVSGSGPQDRNETLAGHQPFWVLADHLSRNGIAVLRYDDRGVGASTGKFDTATTVELADDARAMHNYLTSRGEVDAKKVGIIGHSEGGIIAPMLASKSDAVSFIVMLAGPGLRGDEILYLQSELISRAMGLDEKVIRQSRVDSEAMYEIIRSESDQQKMVARLRAYRTRAMAGYTEEMLSEIRKFGDPEDLFEASLSQITAPWFRFFPNYDPIPSLRNASCPVLALIGERDMQVPPLQNIPAIEEALQRGVTKEYSVIELPGLNHLFQTAETGSPAEYGSIEETFAPAALKVISDWVLDQSDRL